MRLYDTQSAHHSCTLPLILYKPHGLQPSGYSHTLHDSFSLLGLLCWHFAPSHPFPHGYFLPSTPRAPFSHSISLGSRRPAHLQYACASSQLTQTTGWSAIEGRNVLSSQPGGSKRFVATGRRWLVSSTNRLYCAFVTVCNAR